MCTILLPIKPEYANKIVEQTKLYEYRKNKCKKQIDRIVIYSTSPVKKVIAEVEVKEIISNSPKPAAPTPKSGDSGKIQKTIQVFQKLNI